MGFFNNEVKESKKNAADHQKALHLLETDYEAGLSLLEKLAQKDYLPSIFRLGEEYYFHQYGEDDTHRAFDLFLKAAKKGHIKACLYVGLMAAHGNGTSYNDRLAEKCLKMAEEEYPEAAQELRILENLKKPVDKEQFEELYARKAYYACFDFYLDLALRGDVEAVYKTAWMYHTGNGVDQNSKMAYSLMNTVSSTDEDFIMLKQELQKSLITEKVKSAQQAYELADYEKAFQYYRAAYHYGDEDNLHRLARMYMEAKGTPCSFYDAYSLYHRLYERGKDQYQFHMKACAIASELENQAQDIPEKMIALAKDMEDGIVCGGLSRALYWYRKARDHGLDVSAEINRLLEKMDAGYMEQAQACIQAGVFEKAHHILMIGAQLGCRECICTASDLCLMEYGNGTDYGKALELLKIDTCTVTKYKQVEQLQKIRNDYENTPESYGRLKLLLPFYVEKGYVDAMVMLAQIMETEDSLQSEILYMQASEMGDLRGHYGLARLWMKDLSSEKKKRAADHLVICAEHDYLDSAKLLYDLEYDFWDETLGKAEQNRRYLYQAAELFFTGRGCHKNEQSGIMYMQKAVEAKDKRAMQYLARFYRNRKDDRQAFHYYQMLAEDRDEEALRYCADACLHGTGTTMSVEQAYSYYSLLAEKGDVEALYHCGMIQKEYGDLQKAVNMFAQAAEQGHANACYQIFDIGYDSNPQVAAEWLKRAYRHNDLQAILFYNCTLLDRAEEKEEADRIRSGIYTTLSQSDDLNQDLLALGMSIQ